VREWECATECELEPEAQAAAANNNRMTFKVRLALPDILAITVASPENPEVFVFGLVERILALLRESGASEEQSLAALRSVESIIPVLGFESKTFVTHYGP
jgi:hypothetical protein